MPKQEETQAKTFYDLDPYLAPYRSQIASLWAHTRYIQSRLTQNDTVSLDAFASGHEFFGLHRTANGWVVREWAPNATAIHLVGDCNDWTPSKDYALQRTSPDGNWELQLPYDALQHGQHWKFRISWHGGCGERIPAFGRRVVQDPQTLSFSAQVWEPAQPYIWRHPVPPTPAFPTIYECHVGMAQEEASVGTYEAFRCNMLPRIKCAGYNTIQIMAIQEHPYYGSFGYHVSSFFAPSSRFGTPEELMALIDEAHGLGLTVIMDLVHSHAVANEVEGLSRFDGSLFQYFHEGPLGQHPAWGSRCFDYGKPQVIHFLLSNCRYWIDAFHIDGFRFDGITSMLYRHRGLGTAFLAYDDYFNDQLDRDAVAYLTLANTLIHQIKPGALTIAEDVSGFPGLAAPLEWGGCGFDFRLAMGLPDAWFSMVRKHRDEEWSMSHLYHCLTDHRKEERTISYVESHDQAIVGDKTMAFELMDALMYSHMRKSDESLTIDRGIALHKMIRLATAAAASGGYLNFMGNEFGHPEWIDFPREGNGWSYQYARRQWSLCENPDLRYRDLATFDAAMLQIVQNHLDPTTPPRSVTTHDGDLVLAYTRGDLLFVFNFHPSRSYTSYGLAVEPGLWQRILDSDESRFGGFSRIEPHQQFQTRPIRQEPRAKPVPMIQIYLPARTAIVLQHRT